MRSATRAGALAILLVLAHPGGALASAYAGWGDTDWVYASKRECCNAAITMAQQYSMEACINVGGTPSPMRGAKRGTCESSWMQAPDGGLLYRCYSEASVWCR